MKSQRRKFTPQFKSRVVLEAISEKDPIEVLEEKFDLDRRLISSWKKTFISKAHLVFILEENDGAGEIDPDSNGITTEK